MAGPGRRSTRVKAKRTKAVVGSSAPLTTRDAGISTARAPSRAAELVGELGALLTTDRDGAKPVWMTPEGHLVTADYSPPADRRSPAATARWALAPLAWRHAAEPLTERARATVGRVVSLGAGRPDGISGPTGGPVGYLHREAGPSRLPLHSAHHPITGDQLLTTNRWEATDLGYGEPALLRIPRGPRSGDRAARYRPAAAPLGVALRAARARRRLTFGPEKSSVSLVAEQKKPGFLARVKAKLNKGLPAQGEIPPSSFRTRPLSEAAKPRGGRVAGSAFEGWLIRSHTVGASRFFDPPTVFFDATPTRRGSR